MLAHKQQADTERTEGRGDREARERRWVLQGPGRLQHTPCTSAPVPITSQGRPCASFSGHRAQPAPARAHTARRARRIDRGRAETNWPNGAAR